MIARGRFADHGNNMAQLLREGANDLTNLSLEP
jgi:hypothetical protein